jgi:hypothetical protein
VEKVFPRYFPKMKSYRSFRRQLNLYGILIQNHPSRKFSFHGVMSPPAKSGVAGARERKFLRFCSWSFLLLFGLFAEVKHRPFGLTTTFIPIIPTALRLSSGVYSHPLLLQDRPDLAARIPRMAAAAPYPTPPPPPSRGHYGKTTFFIHDTTASGNSSTSISTTITTDAALHSVRSNPESPNTADYYSFYNNSNKSTTGSPSTPRAMVSPETKSSTTFPPNIILALDAEPATKSFFSLMNDLPSLMTRGGLLDDQQHRDYMINSNKNRNPVMILPSIATSHNTTEDVTRTWIDDSSNKQLLPSPSLIGLRHHQQSLDSTTNRHDEDIRLEIIRTFL